jgi:hypothetical protein
MNRYLRDAYAGIVGFSDDFMTQHKAHQAFKLKSVKKCKTSTSVMYHAGDGSKAFMGNLIEQLFKRNEPWNDRESAGGNYSIVLAKMPFL